MKKVFFSILIICTYIFICGCNIQRNGEEVEINKTEEVLQIVEEFTGFSAKAKVTYYIEGKEVIFTMLQDGTIDGKYRIELLEPEGLLGNVTYNDGESIYHVNVNRSKQAYVSANDYPERVEILLSSFIANYRENTKEFSKIGEATEGQYIVLEGVVDGSTTYLAKEQLIIDSITYKPIMLNIYSESGEKFVTIEYIEAHYNPTFEDAYFTPIKSN